MVSKQWLLNTQKKLVTQRSMVIAASFLKAKKCVCQHDEAERAAMDETPPADETHKKDPCEELYKEYFLTMKITLVANAFANPILTPRLQIH
jgi:hypothetical protein